MGRRVVHVRQTIHRIAVPRSFACVDDAPSPRTKSASMVQGPTKPWIWIWFGLEIQWHQCMVNPAHADRLPQCGRTEQDSFNISALFIWLEVTRRSERNSDAMNNTVVIATVTYNNMMIHPLSAFCRRLPSPWITCRIIIHLVLRLSSCSIISVVYLGSIKNIHLYIFRNLNFVFSVLICRSLIFCILALGSGQRLLYRLGSGLGLVLVLRFCTYSYGGVYS